MITWNGMRECLIPMEICNLSFSGQVFPFLKDLESSPNATETVDFKIGKLCLASYRPSTIERSEPLLVVV